MYSLRKFENTFFPSLELAGGVNNSFESIEDIFWYTKILFWHLQQFFL
jgi:hypothetical protein